MKSLRDKVGWVIVSLGLLVTSRQYRAAFTSFVELGMATLNNPEAHKVVDPVGYYRMTQAKQQSDG